MSAQQLEIFGPNEHGQYTVMRFTDHYEVVVRVHSKGAAESYVKAVSKPQPRS